ncbi:MAG: AMP-binding protein, partial [Desulfatiglandales bacterium]
MDPGIEPLDLRYILFDSDTLVLLTTEEGLETLKEAESLGPKDQPLPVKETIVLGEGGGRGSMSYRELLDLGRDVEEEVFRSLPRPKPFDPVAIMYTSGTTGRRKGVILNSLGLVNKSMASMARQGIDGRDRLCLFFPLFHMFGNTCIALSGLLVGATLIMSSNTFDPEKVLKAMCQERCTAIFGSPSMFLSLLDHSLSKKGSWEGVKKGTIGGASCPSELMRRLVVDLGVKGLVTAYGITEASSWITMADPEDPMELKLKTVGRALPCCEVKIVDLETGEDLGIGRQGEIVTRGYLMKGYHNLPQATEQAIDQWGWFHTGDLESMD